MTRPPPSDPHVEAQLLAAVMIDADQWPVIVDLSAETFYSLP